MFDHLQPLAFLFSLLVLIIAHLVETILIRLVLVMQVFGLSAQLHLLFWLALLHAWLDLLQLVLDLGLLLALFGLADEHSTRGLCALFIHPSARECGRFACRVAFSRFWRALGCRHIVRRLWRIEFGSFATRELQVSVSRIVLAHLLTTPTTSVMRSRCIESS